MKSEVPRPKSEVQVAGEGLRTWTSDTGLRTITMSVVSILLMVIKRIVNNINLMLAPWRAW